MAVVVPGDGVLKLMRGATKHVTIVAPYIKSPTLRQLLAAVPNTVTDRTCITRWLPEDISSGVCDLGIFEDVMKTRGGRLLVHPHLHAKYYSDGQQCLVGSANLTARGLGWSTPSNVELLVALPADFPGLADWEAALFDSAILATEDLRDQLREEAERLKESGDLRYAPEIEDELREDDLVSLWVPGCPVPEQLWHVYQGRGVDTMVSSAFEAAHDDLAALSAPNGLSQELFEAYVAGILKQMPLLSEIDQLASTGMTDARAFEFLTERLGPMNDINPYEQVWRVIKLWLVYFFPDSFRLETGQDVLVKGRRLSCR